MKKVKTAQKYFTQKIFSVTQIILTLIVIVSAIVVTFVYGGGPIGLPFLILGIIGLFICASTKVKDGEIDQLLKRIIAENKIPITNTTIECYDLSVGPVKIRKDSKKCSPKYFVTNISSASTGETVFDVYCIDLINESVQLSSYTVGRDTKVTLAEESIITKNGTLKTPYLKILDFQCEIPVTLNDYNISKIIEDICNK